MFQNLNVAAAIRDIKAELRQYVKDHPPCDNDVNVGAALLAWLRAIYVCLASRDAAPLPRV